jgi:hypothetical protein
MTGHPREPPVLDGQAQHPAEHAYLPVHGARAGPLPDLLDGRHGLFALALHDVVGNRLARDLIGAPSPEEAVEMRHTRPDLGDVAGAGALVVRHERVADLVIGGPSRDDRLAARGPAFLILEHLSRLPFVLGLARLADALALGVVEIDGPSAS